MAKIKKSTIVYVSLLFLSSIVVGVALGWGVSETRNIKNSEYITEFETALPTTLLDINGEVITEFASDERREIIALTDLPNHLIDTILTREDRAFYEHKGYSVIAIFRAFIGVLTRRSLGGGSTLTQQIAGTLYADRSDISVMRKIRELWWAMQMERRYSKNEIMEMYLNRVYFGGGTYGVNAAAKYYFGHGALEITPAEAAILVIQLSNPAYYNPFNHPNRARDRQRNVLDAMVDAGYISRENADESFDNYWANFDYTRTSVSAYYMRDDKAPWFSEYVRRELETMIYGSQNIYTSGFTVNTTLNLANQKAAEEVMARYINRANMLYQQDKTVHLESSFQTYIPFTEIISLMFDLPGIKVSEQRSEVVATSTFVNTINPILDISSLMFGIDSLKVDVINRANAISKENDVRTTIEGTMIALETDTGYITSLVGGSKFEENNQYIRAVQARLQPGSAFKPLYYSAAIDSRQFTPGTVISDTPQVFYTSDGRPYIPQNFRGEWMGNVQLWYALAHSMNVPSIKILHAIGFNAAIERAIALLGIPSNEIESRAFVPGYPIGLGVCSVRPIELARAYAVIGNQGREVTPIAIRTVEDRNGNVIYNPELEIRRAQQAKGSDIQVITPQTSYVMTQLLENTTDSGTLAWGLNRMSSVGFDNSGPGTKMTQYDSKGSRYTIPTAGKTGTTQNWADAWAVGYSPYYTATFWFGFDKRGQSLGLNITGSTLAGVAWGDWMQAAHAGLPYKDFIQPATGVTQITVCSDSGMLPTPNCGNHTVTQWYFTDTIPTESCSFHSNNTSSIIGYERLKNDMYRSGLRFTQTIDTTPLTYNLNLSGSSIYSEGLENRLPKAPAENMDSFSIPDRNYLLE